MTTATKKHAATKTDTFEAHEFKVAMEEMCDEEDPKEMMDKAA